MFFLSELSILVKLHLVRLGSVSTFSGRVRSHNNHLLMVLLVQNYYSCKHLTQRHGYQSTIIFWLGHTEGHHGLMKTVCLLTFFVGFIAVNSIIISLSDPVLGVSRSGKILYCNYQIGNNVNFIHLDLITKGRAGG